MGGRPALAQQKPSGMMVISEKRYSARRVTTPCEEPELANKNSSEGEEMINVSNHPSTKWGEKQKAAASKWCCGTILDLPFPAVPPDATLEEVVQMAKGLTDVIKASGHTACHIMGESGLVFGVVTLLAEDGGIQPLHSTTERKVIETINEDGSVTKTAQFEFVQFRGYF